MKYLVDANLPYKLAKTLRLKGYNVIHTDDLPEKERTIDRQIRKVANEGNLIIITKDSDFLDSHIVNGNPSKLLLVSTGNIMNKDLMILLNDHFALIDQLFNEYNFIELNNENLIAHDN